jgi:DNA-binding transcriptional ArsR family regulator
MKSIMERRGEVKEKILRIIWETENPVTTQEISEKMGLKARSVNMHLLGLRKAGLTIMSGGGYVITAEGKEIIGFPKIDEETAEKILSKIPQENAFYFYTGIDLPLGVPSDSLTDLCEKIRSIDVRTIEFHMARGDFESWIHHLGDIELEKRLGLIKELKLIGEALREKLYAALKSRCDELLEIVS